MHMFPLQFSYGSTSYAWHRLCACLLSAVVLLYCVQPDFHCYLVLLLLNNFHLTSPRRRETISLLVRLVILCLLWSLIGLMLPCKPYHSTWDNLQI